MFNLSVTVIHLLPTGVSAVSSAVLLYQNGLFNKWSKRFWVKHYAVLIAIEVVDWNIDLLFSVKQYVILTKEVVDSNIELLWR